LIDDAERDSSLSLLGQLFGEEHPEFVLGVAAFPSDGNAVVWTSEDTLCCVSECSPPKPPPRAKGLKRMPKVETVLQRPGRVRSLEEAQAVIERLQPSYASAQLKPALIWLVGYEGQDDQDIVYLFYDYGDSRR
jgi:hypothetical protein